MNLRHKKPINSYRGQANNDKNEFNDDDFRHQPSPSKKLVGSTGEQIYKYSKILTKFIMNANQYYRQRNKNHKKQKTDLENILEEAKTTKEEHRNLKYEKKLQQPKQKRKIISKIQHDKQQFKQEKQKQSHKIEAQSILPNNFIDLEQQKIPLKPLSAKTSVSVNEPIPPKNEPQSKQKNPLPIPENFPNIYSPGIPMSGFPNPNLLAGMNVNQYMDYYNQMMKLSMIQQMIKNQQFKGMGFPGLGPQMIPGMVPNIDLLNLKQNMYQNYMRSLAQQAPQAQIPKRNAPIHNLNEVFLTQQESIFNQSKQHPNQIVKRANFHIGIAYHIYLKELETKGVDIKDTNLIDPIRQSREIKEREMGTRRASRSRTKK